MPPTKIVIYQESKDNVPLNDWLATLPRRVRARCDTKMALLAANGHELRRPHADYLRDGVYELRVGFAGKNYRILYAFIGHQVVLLTHGLVKESRVPSAEIDKAILCKTKWEADRTTHTYKE